MDTKTTTRPCVVSRDKFGEPFELKFGTGEDIIGLMEMYDDFSPRPASQGLPPEDSETRRSWVENVFTTGMNFLACREGKVLGHAALIPDPGGRSAEFIIFVHQDYRNLGIGTALARRSLEEASRMGYESVWLTVANTNYIAIKLYRKLGFQICEMDACERTMEIGTR
ncbi:MAG: GNAT family N-acetyltransferase [Deltaproteobacteria bacterium]|nr:GNAT family N-acetyltransferase [Deltaproteobacteria bacterium]MBW2016836.1 GNAT family N-acetyltransferase [Deltaproteobacteria bacterium]MBW2130319.1 GNAT family N-acetyltransferase [Deltaproteobacteria bacterium]MBW2302714.1 GNAT family N-acetyltransferase [Deltaproteobacteria bacterium]